MKKTEMGKIKVKRDQPKVSSIEDFLREADGASERTVPWEKAVVDLKQKKHMSQITLPHEYYLKLEYLKKESGITLQEIARRGIAHQIDLLLADLKK
ncbi:MAG: hypothetical protein HQ517_02410 [SAR324 cluster bacterium]|nr:hypothetical protein [SAR324 cluster bacterium]